MSRFALSLDGQTLGAQVGALETAQISSMNLAFAYDIEIDLSELAQFELSALTEIYLQGSNKVSGLDSLGRFPALRSIVVDRNQFSVDEIVRFTRAYPNITLSEACE